jgi:outer membrane protein TolC
MHKRLALMIAAIAAIAIGQGCDSVVGFLPAGIAAAPAAGAQPPAGPDRQPGEAPAGTRLPAEPTLADYLTAAALNNPALAAAYADWQAELERIPQVRALPDPQLTYFPDVTLGLMWMDNAPSWKMHPADPGENPPMAMVSVNLPIWFDKLEAGVREAKARHIAALRRRVDMSNDFRSRVKMAAFQYRDALGKLDLYQRVLIPRAGEALRTTETNYSTGAATFADLLDSQRVLLEFQLVYQQAVANRARQLAMLEMLIGRQLPTQQTPTTQPTTQPGK